jgi:hypothetical protein
MGDILGMQVQDYSKDLIISKFGPLVTTFPKGTQSSSSATFGGSESGLGIPDLNSKWDLIGSGNKQS